MEYSEKVDRYIQDLESVRAALLAAEDQGNNSLRRTRTELDLVESHLALSSFPTALATQSQKLDLPWLAELTLMKKLQVALALENCSQAQVAVSQIGILLQPLANLAGGALAVDQAAARTVENPVVSLNFVQQVLLAARKEAKERLRQERKDRQELTVIQAFPTVEGTGRSAASDLAWLGELESVLDRKVEASRFYLAQLERTRPAMTRLLQYVALLTEPAPPPAASLVESPVPEPVLPTTGFDPAESLIIDPVAPEQPATGDTPLSDSKQSVAATDEPTS